MLHEPTTTVPAILIDPRTTWLQSVTSVPAVIEAIRLTYNHLTTVVRENTKSIVYLVVAAACSDTQVTVTMAIMAMWRQGMGLTTIASILDTTTSLVEMGNDPNASMCPSSALRHHLITMYLEAMDLGVVQAGTATLMLSAPLLLDGIRLRGAAVVMRLVCSVQPGLVVATISEPIFASCTDVGTLNMYQYLKGSPFYCMHLSPIFRCELVAQNSVLLPKFVSYVPGEIPCVYGSRWLP